MKRSTTCALLVCLVGCSGQKQGAVAPTPAAPAVATSAPTMVSVLSEKTGQMTAVIVSPDDPQPPSCAWRDLVIAKHIALGGSTNDIVTLANQHKVFIQDQANGYALYDVPGPWCLE